MVEPLVDVVIPCFNDGETLASAVASAFQQPETAQIFVIDDGSTEKATVDELVRLAAEHVVVIRQENTGPGVARRRGLTAASAPYVFLLDADDELCPGALEAMVDHLRAHPELAAVWCDHERFGDAAGVLRFRRRLDPWLITYFNHMPFAHSLVRREIALAVEPTLGWRMGYTYDDWELAMAFAERGLKGEGLPVPLYRYQVRSNRLGEDQLKDHAELYARLRACHLPLFFNRRRNWFRSDAPWIFRLGLPVIERLPISRTRKLLFAWALNDVADGEIRALAWYLSPRVKALLMAGKHRLRGAR